MLALVIQCYVCNCTTCTACCFILLGVFVLVYDSLYFMELSLKQKRNAGTGNVQYLCIIYNKNTSIRFCLICLNGGGGGVN